MATTTNNNKNESNNKPSLQPLYELMEKAIMGGGMEVDSTLGIATLTYEDANWYADFSCGVEYHGYPTGGGWEEPGYEVTGVSCLRFSLDDVSYYDPETDEVEHYTADELAELERYLGSVAEEYIEKIA